MLHRYAGVTIDLGTGDGRYVLAAAAADPHRLVIGVDANAAGMTDAARRAMGTARRTGVANAVFLAAAAEALPQELDSVADLVTAHFP
jgi:16S rRNA (adenine(1408)-N(1))-methyltransferase